MKLTTFFINHPIIAVVLNVMIVVIGILCLNNVSIREYPDVSLPIFTVYANYPNASPELVESSVTNILEERLAGVEGIKTMTSTSGQGNCSIELHLQEGTSIERALISVREAIGLARSNLPKEVFDPIVQRRGKSNGTPFAAIALSSSHFDFGQLTHYANLYLKNTFRSLKGVASVDVVGQSYTMTITLDPKKMYAFGVNPDEVRDALEKSNVSWPVGKFHNEVPISLDLRLTAKEDFDNLFIKEDKGKPIFLKEVAETQLKTDGDQFRVRINGKPGLVLSISRSSDANPLEVSKALRQQIAHLKQSLAKEITIDLVLDQSTFIKNSLYNIESSIGEAICLILIIVFLFLGNLRATFIPLVTLPISLVGSLILIKVFGCSINTLTLLAMVLAVGLVVDDAIVVLENISRHREKGLTSLQAAIKGSREIGFAIIAMTLTLASVYMPIAFVQGAIGQLFIEFAITLAGSVLISGVVALTLSPVMCARILKGSHQHRWPKVGIYLKNLELLYARGLKHTLAHPKIVVGIALTTLVSAVLLFYSLPSEIAPREDRGLMGIHFPSMPGKGLDDLEKRVVKIEDTLKSLPEVKSCLTFMGEWGANICLLLKEHSQRTRSPAVIIEAIEPQLKTLPSMDAWPWSWDSGLPGMDEPINSSELTLAISTVESYRDLFLNLEQVQKIIEKKNIFSSTHHDLRLDNPEYIIHLDKYKAAQLGIFPAQIAKALEIFFSEEKSLSFAKEGIRYAITLKGKTNPWTLNELYITNKKGKRISLGAIAELTPISLPKQLLHYNQMRSASLSVSLHLNQRMESMMPVFWDLVSQHTSPSLKKDWKGAAKASQESSATMALLFGMALIFIYAILTVQFENFIDPFIIMLTVPLGCCGALFSVWILGQSFSIYTQIGLITLIGLITKHGILIVEFAGQLQKKSHSLEEAIQEASLLRLRPILITTSAMVLGALPLLFSTGAGAEARRSLGVVLVGGLLFGTSFTLFILPKLYHLIKTSRSQIWNKFKNSS